MHSLGMPMVLDRPLPQTPIQSQIYAKILLDSGMSIVKVASRTGLGKNTVNQVAWNQSYSTTMLDEFKRRLPFKAYRLADDVLDCIDVDEIKKAPLGVKMMAFGVAIDKARDMEGSNRPIFNIVSVINECKTTRDKLNAQMASIETAIVGKQQAIGPITVEKYER